MDHNSFISRMFTMKYYNGRHAILYTQKPWLLLILALSSPLPTPSQFFFCIPRCRRILEQIYLVSTLVGLQDPQLIGSPPSSNSWFASVLVREILFPTLHWVGGILANQSAQKGKLKKKYSGLHLSWSRGHDP